MAPTSGSTSTNTTENKRSVSEVGHAKNVANFHDLITFCQGYGTAYNPSKEGLAITQLLAKRNLAQEKVAAVLPKNHLYNDGVNARMQVFEVVKALSTKVINALDATNASNGKISEAKVINRKIQGKRAKTSQAGSPDSPVPATISVSQQSYDMVIQHFENLVTLLETEPNYTPNENHLSISQLHEQLTAMKNTNNAIAALYTDVDNARMARNQVLYDPQTGLLETASGVKKYVKSLFGPTSPEYKQISGIIFRKIRS